MTNAVSLTARGPGRAALATLFLALLAAPFFMPAHAAVPGNGTLSAANPTVTWSGEFKPSTASANCNGPDNTACDNFKLSILAPGSSFRVDITITPVGADDWDMEVYGPDGNKITGSGNAPGQQEIVVLGNPASGTYTVAAAPYAVSPLAYAGKATLVLTTSPPPPPPGGLTYSLHIDPVGRGSGEPNLGINPHTEIEDNGGTIMDIVGLNTLRVRFNDCTSPPSLRETDSEGDPTWVDVSPLSHVESLDPIIFTDQTTGRTFSSQLLGKTSAMEFTDDDGESWLPCQGSGINSGVDHQTVGGGPFAPPLTGGTPAYENAVYYCSQDAAVAQCAVSLTGCTTFGAAVPMYNLTQCSGLHGHVKVAPDGTVYVPNKNCGGEQGVARSSDNGTTWEVLTVPGSTAASALIKDPSVGIGSDGTVYFGFVNGDGRPMAAVSTDRGESWSAPIDVGAAFGLRDAVFPSVTAGDGDRAAFAFHGTKTANQTGDNPNSGAVWHLYIATTYDRGANWETVSVAPADPVQRGTICGAGFGLGACANGTRNLLDFMDIQTDRRGRPVVSFADGCLGATCIDNGVNTLGRLASLARLKGGRGLYSEFDVPPGPPASPLVRATVLESGGVRLDWQEPNDGGAPIDSYKIYRETISQAPVLLATVPFGVLTYTDGTVNVEDGPLYEVTAVNTFGESPVKPGCDNRVEPETEGSGPVEDVCIEPGLTIVDDPAGDGNLGPAPPPLDIRKLSIAEPDQLGGADKLIFTLKVEDLTVVPQQARWTMFFSRAGSPSNTEYFVAMTTGSVGTVGFIYGHTFIDPTNGLRTLVTDGTADPGSGFSADGTIRLVISNSKLTFNINGGTSPPPAAGEVLSVINAITQQQAGVLLATIDGTANGTHQVHGNANCANRNRPPVVVNDFATTEVDTSIVIDVLANDSDPDGDPLTITGITLPGNGQAVIVSEAGVDKVRYTPNPGFIGSDSFNYTVNDGHGHPREGTVNVTVTDPGGNRPPVAGNDSATTLAGRSVRIAVLANDSDPDNDPLTVISVTQPANGSAAINADNTVTYAPNTGFVGSDGFGYQISDGRGGLASASVGVTVEENACVAPGITVVTDPLGDTNAVINPTSDPSLDIARVSLAEPFFGPGAEKLVVTLEVDDFAVPHPSAAWRVFWTSPNGVQNFVSLESCDATAGLQCSYGTFDGTLFSAAGSPEGCEWDADGTLTMTVDKGLVGISDSTDIGTSLSNLNGRTQVFIGALCTGLLGQADNAGPGGYTIRGNAVCGNQAPVAVDDSATTDEDVPVAIAPLANDSDPDGDPIFLAGFTQAANGAVTDNGDGTLTYTPSTGFFGSDSFTYRVSDGELEATGTVNVTVRERNRPPVPLDDEAFTDEGIPVIIDVLANDTDPNGDPLVIVSVTQPANGTVVINGDNTLTYTPNPGFSGDDFFTYTVADGRGGSGTAGVTVHVERDDTGGAGRVHGSGFWHTLAGDKKLNFSFDARPKEGGALKGKLQINDREADVSIDARTILSLGAGSGSCNGVAPGAGSFELTARGSFNGADGATFRVCGVDNGNPGKGDATHPADRLHVECTSGCNYDTASRTPDDGIDGGNIHLHGSPGGGSATTVATRSIGVPAAVLELDPILLTSVPAGVPQLLVAVAHTDGGLGLASRAVTLTWSGDGGAGSATALTDLYGVALFWVTAPAGETEYLAHDGALESNAIALTGATPLP